MRVLVVAEVQGGQARRATLAAVTFARRALAGGTSFDVLVLGNNVSAATAALARYGAERVLVGDHSSLERYHAERYAPAVVALAREYQLVVAAASAFGRDLLPRAAGALDAAYVGDVTGVSVEADQLVIEHPMYAGNVLGYCTLETPIQFVTVRQSELPAAEPDAGPPSRVETVEVPPAEPAAARIDWLGFDDTSSDRPELTEARVVVAGGRGLRDRFSDLLEPLAHQLDAAIGATRAVCDAGLAPDDQQVGQTGKVVAPDLYLAFGISGAIQHVAGMRGSKVVAAVNLDPEAPIFDVADYGLVGDAQQVIIELTAALRELKGG